VRNSRIIVTVLTAMFTAFQAGRLPAQAKVETPVWEILARASFPQGTLPNVYVYRATAGPAPNVPPAPGAGHTHPGPVFVYILQGQVESQIEPDPPAIYTPGEFFYEAPGRVHRFLRNASKTEPYMLLTFQTGHTERAGAPKPLHRENLLSTVNQEVSLLRLTLAPGAGTDVSANANPDIIYVLEGRIETAEAKTYSTGDIFSKPAGLAGRTIRNANASEPAKLLLYQVSDKYQVNDKK
jgi:quercetin dioxygenase-like cupin family protein